MNRFHRKPLSTIRPVCHSLLVLMLMLAITGCSTVSKTAQKLTTGGDKLKKRVALAVFTNRTALNTPAFNQTFHNELIARLSKKCSNNILIKPGDLEYPKYLSDLPRDKYGDVDHFDLAQVARRMGFNAVISGSLVAVKTDEIKKGYWWFEKSLPVALINISVEIFDPESASKLMDENFRENVKIDETEMASINQNKLHYTDEINKALGRVVDTIAEKACDKIAGQSWKAFVISVTENKVVLSSGSDTQISTGDILEVFDSTQIIEGINGQKYFLPGLKTAEIKVTAVFTDRTEAIVISGESIKAGFSVKPK